DCLHKGLVVVADVARDHVAHVRIGIPTGAAVPNLAGTRRVPAAADVLSCAALGDLRGALHMMLGGRFAARRRLLALRIAVARPCERDGKRHNRYEGFHGYLVWVSSRRIR